MTATAAGIPPLTNQWYKDNTLLTGQTNLTFSITNAAVGDSGNYTLVVANAYGSTTSAVQTDHGVCGAAAVPVAELSSTPLVPSVAG